MADSSNRYINAFVKTSEEQLRELRTVREILEKNKEALEDVEDAIKNPDNTAGEELEKNKNTNFMDSMKKMFTKLTDKMKGAGSAVGGASGAAKDKAKGFDLSTITGILTGLGGFLLKLTGLKALGGLIKKFTSKGGVGGLLKWIGRAGLLGLLVLAIDVFRDIGENPAFKKALEKMKALWNDTIKPLFMQVADWYEKTLKPVLQVFVADVMTAIVSAIEGIVSSFKKIFNGDILGGVTELVTSLGGAVLDIFDSAMKGILKLFGVELGEQKFLSFALDKIVELKDYVLENWQDILGALWNGVKAATEWIKDRFVFTGELLFDFGVYMKDKALEAFDWLKGAFIIGAQKAGDYIGTTIWPWIQEKAQALWNWVTDLFQLGANKAADIVGDINTWIKGKATDIWNSIKGAFQLGTETVVNFGDNIATFVSTKATEVWEKIKSFLDFSEQIDAAKSGIAGAKEFLEETVQSIWDRIKGLFDFSNVDLPKVLTDPQQFLKDILQNVLPARDSWYAKVIPNEVYDFAGITGQAEQPNLPTEAPTNTADEFADMERDLNRAPETAMTQDDYERLFALERQRLDTERAKNGNRNADGTAVITDARQNIQTTQQFATSMPSTDVGMVMP